MAGTNQIKISKLPTKENPSTNDYLVMDDASETSKIKAKDFINSFYPDFINLFYPVGSIYMSVNDIEPSVLFGGTWEKIKDRFLLASGDTYTTGNTGGEATHTLTVNEMPSHEHPLSSRWGVSNVDVDSYRYQSYKIFIGNQSSYIYSQNEKTPTNPTYTYPTGDNKAHNNMPPYLVVNIWQRIS